MHANKHTKTNIETHSNWQHTQSFQYFKEISHNKFDAIYTAGQDSLSPRDTVGQLPMPSLLRLFSVIVTRASTQLAVAKLLQRFRYVCLACLAPLSVHIPSSPLTAISQANRLPHGAIRFTYFSSN